MAIGFEVYQYSPQSHPQLTIAGTHPHYTTLANGTFTHSRGDGITSFAPGLPFISTLLHIPLVTIIIQK